MDTVALKSLFTDQKSIEFLSEIEMDGVQLGMTPFQIQHFVLNRREFTTDFAQFQQAKLELYHRLQNLFDLYYQRRTARANILLAEGTIENLERKKPGKIRDAKIELQKVELDRNNFTLLNIQHTAMEKLKEASVFKKVYDKYKKFDSMKPEEIAKLEEEAWRIKSAYYPELGERYGLTPSGFLALPHEKNGIKELTGDQHGI